MVAWSRRRLPCASGARAGRASPSRALLAALALAGAAHGATPRCRRPTARHSGSRGAVDVYERTKPSLKACLIHVAGDLKDRAARVARACARGRRARRRALSRRRPDVEPQSSLLEMREALAEVAANGPPGLSIGVLGAACEDSPPGPASRAARDALTGARRPSRSTGRRTCSRRCATRRVRLHMPATEPRAVVLVTREGGDGEDDVEGTRDLLKERGVAFYSIAPEAAFERPWDYDFKDRPVPDLGLTQRWTPLAKRRDRRASCSSGCDVGVRARALRVGAREFPLAQTEFHVRRAAGGSPARRGFGYWSLATLSCTSGGRCFVYDFARGGGSAAARGERRAALRLRVPQPLRARPAPPTGRAARALGEPQATAIVRVWEFLADEEAPVVLDHGTLERAGASLVVAADAAGPLGDRLRGALRDDEGRGEGARSRGRAQEARRAGARVVDRRGEARDHARRRRRPTRWRGGSRPTSTCSDSSCRRCASTGARSSRRSTRSTRRSSTARIGSASSPSRSRWA